MESSPRRVGIMGAMQEEVAGLIALLQEPVAVERGRRTYYRGRLEGVEVVIVFSRWGKVAAATTLTHLLLEFGITELIFTGMAGGIAPGVRVGDLVLGTRFYQHDLDATPILPRFEIPLLGLSSIDAPPAQLGHATAALEAMVAGPVPGIGAEVLARFGLHSPRLHAGAIASGDKFFADRAEKEALQAVLPDVLCVEMEGAAVAQVCYEYGLPITIVRVVSDGSDEHSEQDFVAFTLHVASLYSVEVVRRLLQA